MAHSHQTPAQAYGFSDGRPLSPIASVAQKLVAALARWEVNLRTRNQLKYLDDYLLDDIGVTRDLARKEATRPFWQG
ncbi:MAG: DUF1127 domain-containing protein [Rhodobacteraceae bacterium]|nr:MAG: DUF1127 domain-containing protein [Paracoccaceae bacterium]